MATAGDTKENELDELLAKQRDIEEQRTEKNAARKQEEKFEVVPSLAREEQKYRENLGAAANLEELKRRSYRWNLLTSKPKSVKPQYFFRIRPMM
jgi:phosphoglycolate phosphatase-like HAD superfamily hydrolase